MNMKRRVCSALLAAFAASAAFAQSTGGIRVRVIDAGDKSALIGAIVNLSDPQKRVPNSTLMADKDGIAYFPVIKAGSGYVITITMDGYARIDRPDVKVTTSQVTELVFMMVPELTEKVQVIAERTKIDLEQKGSSTKYSDEFISDLPVAGRFYQNVLSLAPGVQDADGDGNPNVNGARDRDFRMAVGGVSNQDPLTGQWMNFVNPDSIESVEVITSGAGAEYGRAAGGFGSIVQKQGSNEFEGVVNMIYRTNRLDGSGNVSVPEEFEPKFTWAQPSFQVSGKIVADKLWYRLSHEYWLLDLPVQTGSATYVQTREQWTHSDQLTWQVSPRNKLALSWDYNPITTDNLGVSQLTPPESTYKSTIKSPTYKLAWDAPYSANLLVQTTIAYQDRKSELHPTTRGLKNTCIAGFLDDTLCFNAVTGVVSGSAPNDVVSNSQRFTFNSEGTYFKNRLWGMNHQFRFGIRVENERFQTELERRPNTSFFVYTPATEQQAGSSRPPDLEQVGILQVVVPIDPVSVQRVSSSNWEIFGSDQFRPVSNLVLTLGLRVAREQIESPNGYQPFDPGAEYENFVSLVDAGLADEGAIQSVFTAYERVADIERAIESQVDAPITVVGPITQGNFYPHVRRPGALKIVNTNWQPRFNLSWDPGRDGRTRISASAGRYAGAIILAAPLREAEVPVVGFEITATGKGGKFVVDPDQDVYPGIRGVQMSRNTKTPYTDEFTLGFERELPIPETSFSVTYIHRNFKQQLQDIDLNRTVADYGRCVLTVSAGTEPVQTSPGTGTYEDPYHPGTFIEDTDPGDGDGILDDCAGELLPISEGTPGDPFNRGDLVERPDGRPDLYIRNPQWGPIYEIGNYNSGRYDGVQLQLIRRQYNGWQMDASYTWSRNVGQAEDFEQVLGNDNANLDDEKGYVGFDQRHVVKLNAAVITKANIRLGTTISWQSGLPYSLQAQQRSYNTLAFELGEIGSPDPSTRIAYPTRQRNDQRNPGYWNVDVRIAKEFKVGRRLNIQLGADIFNLLDDDTYIIYNEGLKYGRIINGTAEGTRNFGRRYQVSAKLQF